MLTKNFFQKSGQLCPKVPQTNQRTQSKKIIEKKFRKKPEKFSEKMGFPGVSENSIWNFQGLIKSEAEFPRVTKKKQCGICRALGFWPWNCQGI